MDTEKQEVETGLETQLTQNNEEQKTQENLMEMTPQELCELLHSEIENTPLEKLKNRVEELKIVFYKKIKQLDETARARFVSEGGEPTQFKPEVSAEELRFKELLGVYRDNRNRSTAASEQQMEENHKAKLAIIEELKTLVDSTETMGATFATFKELQERWRAVGPVSIAVNKDLWETYHHHTENFYNYVQINRELRDMDLKRNYDGKLALCEAAEALENNSSIVAAFNDLQKLHEQYRELGPVTPEQKTELWERFKTASTKINKLHQEHYDKIKEQQLENLAKKTAICERVEALVDNQKYSTLKEWNKAQEVITTSQAEWKTVGFAPKKDNNAIYERFRVACDKFFEGKRAFFAEVKGEQSESIRKKNELILKAEEVAESSDWKAATEVIIKLQGEWKNSGVVGRKDSEVLWRRFRAACDKFFERKGEHFKDSRGKSEEVVVAKREVLGQLVALKGSEELSFDRLKELMHNYGAAGYLPAKLKGELEVEFKGVCDELFEELRGREGAERIEKFRQKVAQEGVANGGARGGSPERDQLNRRLNALQGELKTLENNIGFFGMSKGAEALKAEVERKITKVRADIAEVKAKLKILTQQG